MRIRNLEEYITFLTQGQSIQQLGTPEDPLLNKFVGTDKFLDQYVGTITKIATNTGSQIFYELLQNADDEKASHIFFYFNARAFVVINNAFPFYTDTVSKDRKGQLKSFLQKGDKYRDKEKIGRYGQGSKLLYDLLLSQKEHTEYINSTKEHALQKAVIEECKGPILYSWEGLNQLERFLEWSGEDFDIGPCGDEKIPLLTKILYTYYPSSPGEKLKTFHGDERTLFSYEDLKDCVGLLNQIRSLFDFFKFNRGSMLYIALGEGQYEHLMDIYKTELVHGISPSLAFLRHIENVQILDQDIPKSAFNLHSIPPIHGEDEDFQVTLAVPSEPKLINYELFNFYQYFPVTETIYGLKFIINSKAYEIDGARQRIDLTNPRNKQVLAKIGSSLEAYIDEIWNAQKGEALVQIIKSVVATNLDLIGNGSMIKDALYENLLKKIQTRLPVRKGFTDSTEQVRIKATDIDVSPVDLGFEGWDWLVEDLNEYYSEIIDQLHIEAYTITDLLCKCPDRDKLNVWMSGLSKDTYLQLAEEVVESNGPKPIQEISIARFSNGKAYTLDEVIADETLLLLTPELAPLVSILLSKELVCGGEELFQNPQMAALIDRYGKFKTEEYIKRFIVAISGLQLEREEKWAVFKTLKNITNAESLIRDELLLFENVVGQKRPLKKLLKDAIKVAPSGLLQEYELKASEFLKGEEMGEWLMEENEVWGNLVEDWESIRPELDGELDFNQMVLEMDQIFQAASFPSQKFSSELPWTLTDGNEWRNSKSIFFSTQFKAFSPDDYAVLVQIVHRVTALKTVPFEYITALSAVKFAELPNIGFAQLKETWGEHSLMLNEQELRVFLKLKRSGEEFFDYFLISPDDKSNSYIIHLNDNKSKQYYSTDSLLNDFLSKNGKYYLLPQALLSLLSSSSSLYREDENFALNLIGEFEEAQEVFIDMVLRQGDRVKMEYLNKLPRIDLYTGDEPSSYRNTFEGKVIDMICRNEWASTYRTKVYINNRPINEFNYNDRVEFYLDMEKKGAKFEFSLASLIKKYEGISDTLSEVKRKLFGLSHKEIFSESEKFPIPEIPAQIIRIDNEEQVAFLVSFYKSDVGSNSYNPERFKQRDFSAIDRGRLLSSFERHKIDFFSSFPLPEEWGLNLSAYLWPSDLILALEEELLKEWIIQWTQAGIPPDSRKKFLIAAGLNGDHSAVVKFRSSLIQQRYLDQSCIADIVSSGLDLVVNTIKWAKTRLNWPVSPEGPIASAFHCLFQAFFQKEKRVILHFLMFTKEDNGVKVSLKFFDKTQNSHLYIRKLGKESEEILPVALLHTTHEVINFTHEGYSDEFIQIIRDQGALECWLDKEISVQTGDPIKEWDDPRYDAWKEGAGKNYRIFLSSQELPVNYYLKILNGPQIPIGHFHKGDVDKKKTEEGITQIYLHQKDNDNIFKLLAEHQEKLFKGDEAVLVSLLAMNISSNQIISLSGKVDPQKPAYQFSHQISADEHDKLDKNLEAITKNLDVIKNMAELEAFDVISALLGKGSKAELEWLVANWDEIQLDKEKGEAKPKPVALIGYIGERLVYLWIKGRIQDHNGNSIEHVGSTVREYDVSLTYNGRPYCIEVKTTIKSIHDEDGMTPLFLRPRQYDFIKSNPDKSYILSRISLQDTGLAYIYDQYKYRGNDLHEIIERCGEEIDQHLIAFLNNPSSRNGLRRGHLIFNMNIPKDGQEFWELLEG